MGATDEDGETPLDMTGQMGHEAVRRYLADPAAAEVQLQWVLRCSRYGGGGFV